MKLKHTQAQFQNIERLFREALKLAPPERESFLTTECQSDETLRHEVEELLRSAIDTGPLDYSPIDPSDFARLSTAVTPRLPEQIGQFRIQRVIGSGGMGTIYEAFQESPRRTVALKVMRWELTSPEALRRFHYESELLAKLQHPGIAQVYAAGVHDEAGLQLPFFAMELVSNAEPITRYATANELEIRERLELFAQACDAIEYGHQRGVIHRDLKPSNVLVGKDGRPRVIDFGVARSTDCDTMLTTPQTQTGQLLGTLQYMSPEQCLGKSETIDTRTDVYSLGVVLYELLSGKLPYDLNGMSVYEGTRVVIESAAKPLSSSDKRLRGELETIVHKALEKDRNRRYSSAAELATDIRRFLRGEAISARPPTLYYQLRVFARRNKTLVAAATCVLIVLVGGLISTSAALLKADRALHTSQSLSHELSDALSVTMGTISSVDPAAAEISYGDEPTTEEMLDRINKLLDEGIEFPENSLDEAALRLRLGRAYRHLGRFSEAASHLEQALQIRHAVLGVSPETADCMMELAHLSSQHSHLDSNLPEDQVIQWYDSGQLVACKPAGWSYMARGSRQLTQGELSESLDSYTSALNILTEAEGPESRLIAWCHDSKGVVHHRLNEYEEAEKEFEKALQMRLRVLGPDHSHTIHTYIMLARNTAARGNLDTALSWAQLGLYGVQRHPAIGEDHEYYKLARETYEFVLSERGELDQAENDIANLRESFGNSYFAPTQLLGNYNQIEKSLVYARIAWNAVQDNPQITPNDYEFQDTAYRFALWLSLARRYEDALPLWKTLHEHHDKLPLEKQKWHRYQLAKCYFELGELSESEQLLTLLAAELEQDLSDSIRFLDRLRTLVFLELVSICEEFGKPDEASHWLAKALQHGELAWAEIRSSPRFGPEDFKVQDMAYHYGLCLSKAKRYQDALPIWRSLHENHEAIALDQQLWSRFYMAESSFELGELTECEQLLTSLAQELEAVSPGSFREQQKLKDLTYLQMAKVFDDLGNTKEAAR